MNAAAASKYQARRPLVKAIVYTSQSQGTVAGARGAICCSLAAQTWLVYDKTIAAMMPQSIVNYNLSCNYFFFPSPRIELNLACEKK